MTKNRTWVVLRILLGFLLIATVVCLYHTGILADENKDLDVWAGRVLWWDFWVLLGASFLMLNAFGMKERACKLWTSWDSHRRFVWKHLALFLLSLCLGGLLYGAMKIYRGYHP